jgi:hypothetical protein
MSAPERDRHGGPLITYTPPEAVTWHGWVWRRACWVKVCEAGDIGTCSRLLGEEAKQHGIVNNTFMVMTRGSVPQGAPPGRTGGHHPTPC